MSNTEANIDNETMVTLIEKGDYGAVTDAVIAKLTSLPNPYFLGPSGFNDDDKHLAQSIVWLFTGDPVNDSLENFDALKVIFDAAWNIDADESLLAYAIKEKTIDYCELFFDKLTQEENNAIRERAIEQLKSESDVRHSIKESILYYLDTKQNVHAFRLIKKLHAVSPHDALLAESCFLRQGVGVKKNSALALSREVESMQVFVDSGKVHDYDYFYTLLDIAHDETLMAFCSDSSSVTLDSERFTWYLTNVESFSGIEDVISQIKSLCRIA